ncbi:MAG: DNA-binding protein [Candidatus Jorgensenbacteria bacterium GW2011_GWA1_48_13]|uniref:DNA-binding protein n=2 Tax=Candidatus Joergenseniibacteriota TaxID=1752739 RepID=A0A0G1W9L9_9BACT|nr:MAG: DNA-binding protein [Candidatus Jorgensenbacteria bacterium GW2011_GWA1_48_13]KKU99385.1 MAG: DNA-binding protein [Candidatus Jorgensenbacteria bacterium GW2011_GWC1_48_8]KKW15270.1 MAG: DNA-binding protein [Candidatus Jorgensenbacteria bacterium GW2011_GWB1_50_10]
MEHEAKNFSSILVQAIKAQGLTTEKLAALSGVSDRFLESLVEEKFDSLPAEPYVRGYLLKIAEVLGLDGEALWAEYLKDNDLIKRAGRGDEFPKNRFALPKINVKFVLLGILIVALAAFLFLRLPLFSSGKALELMNPREDSTIVGGRNFTLEGRIDSVYALSVNGERIYPDENGNFEKNVELQEGFNTFVFTFKKALGKEQTLTKQIFYQPVVQTETQ